MNDQIMDRLLELWDWNRRLATEDYTCGYTVAIGQVILDIHKIITNETKPYSHEAYKRAMQDTTMEAYWQKYPKPLADYFPAEIIRDNGGVL